MSDSSWSCRSCGHVNDWGESVCAKCWDSTIDTLLEFLPDCMPAVSKQEQITTLRADNEAKDAEIAEGKRDTALFVEDAYKDGWADGYCEGGHEGFPVDILEEYWEESDARAAIKPSNPAPFTECDPDPECQGCCGSGEVSDENGDGGPCACLYRDFEDGSES